MKIFELFKRKSSKDIAKDRLKLLLVSDRASCSPEIMESIKNDIISVISKYLVIDAKGMDIQISMEDTGDKKMKIPVLFANIPIINIRVLEK